MLKVGNISMISLNLLISQKLLNLLLILQFPGALQNVPSSPDWLIYDLIATAGFLALGYYLADKILVFYKNHVKMG